MADTDTERARVIRFWRAVELFSPPNVPEPDPREHVYEIGDDGPLPWQAGHPLRRITPPERLSWRHTVYGGLFSLRRVRDLLQDTFGPDEESFDERTPGTSALFAITVTGEGRPLLGSAEFASCAWPAGRLLQPGPQDSEWLDGFEGAGRACGREFRKLAAAAAGDTRANELRADGNEVGRLVDIGMLTSLITVVAEHFGVAGPLGPAGLRVMSRKVGRRREFSADGSEFLNSFFASDLARVADAVGTGDYGDALGAYLRGPGPHAVRIDLRAQPHVVDRHVAPAHTPAGRWPARTSQPLVLSQQFAVNTALHELARPGIFAVNGPPGTGKTTMLRELIAALVVERACRLAELTRTEEAFSGQHRWKTSQRSHTVNGWDSRLTGFEIVVASSNNGAVENISREIPGRDAIDSGEWLTEASYYSELATAVLNSDNKGPEVAAWGLVAGRLGKKSNRHKFARAFWLGQPENGIAGFKDILTSYERAPSGWQAALSAFRTALREVDRLREERAAVYQRTAGIPALRGDIEQEKSDQAATRVLLDQISSHLASADSEIAGLERAVARAGLVRQSHREARPGLLAARFGLNQEARDWRTQNRALATWTARAQRQVREAAGRRAGVAGSRRQAQAAARQHQARLEAFATRLGELQHDVTDAVARWGDAVPLPDRDAGTRELSGPWTDPEWNTAQPGFPRGRPRRERSGDLVVPWSSGTLSNSSRSSPSRSPLSRHCAPTPA